MKCIVYQMIVIKPQRDLNIERHEGLGAGAGEG